jgi:hypothetical protein
MGPHSFLYSQVWILTKLPNDFKVNILPEPLIMPYLRNYYPNLYSFFPQATLYDKKASIYKKKPYKAVIIKIMPF